MWLTATTKTCRVQACLEFLSICNSPALVQDSDKPNQQMRQTHPLDHMTHGVNITGLGNATVCFHQRIGKQGSPRYACGVSAKHHFLLWPGPLKLPFVGAQWSLLGAVTSKPRGWARWCLESLLVPSLLFCIVSLSICTDSTLAITRAPWSPSASLTLSYSSHNTHTL